jgi:uncharacterized integral membrane protein
MKHLKYIAAVLIMLLVLVLIVQNQDAFSTLLTFRVDLPGFHAEFSQVSVYYVVTVTFVFGVLVAGLYGIVERYRLKKEIRVLRKASSDKDAELNSLRNLPITSEELTPVPANNSNDAGR